MIGNVGKRLVLSPVDIVLRSHSIFMLQACCTIVWVTLFLLACDVLVKVDVL